MKNQRRDLRLFDEYKWTVRSDIVPGEKIEGFGEPSKINIIFLRLFFFPVNNGDELRTRGMERFEIGHSRNAALLIYVAGLREVAPPTFHCYKYGAAGGRTCPF